MLGRQKRKGMTIRWTMKGSGKLIWKNGRKQTKVRKRKNGNRKEGDGTVLSQK
jgi:hypothetical protein